MAVEWAPHAIRVNAIAPGHIVTPRLYDTPQRVEGYAASLLPMRRRGTPDDIGRAALFLGSDIPRYITGTTLDLDGGLLAPTCFLAACLEATRADFTSRPAPGNVAQGETR
jgi:3-oxoacyl-[acyl-carrier protein] reductase